MLTPLNPFCFLWFSGIDGVNKVSAKTKSGLSLIIYILCIVFMLPHSLYAVTNTDQEIGETYYDQGSLLAGSEVDSAVLAPTGDRLYSVKNGVLRLYNLSPLKRIKSMEVEFDSHQEKEGPYRIFITKDEKRIIVYGKTQLRLLDLESGKIIKAVPFQSELGVLNDDELLTLDNDNKATVWDAYELIKKKDFVASGEERWSLKDHNITIINCTLIKAANFIILYRPAFSSGNGKVFVFDGASYRQIWNLGHNDVIPSALSYDLNTLYVPNNYRPLWYAGQYVDHIGEFRKKDKEARIGEILKIDIATAQVGYMFKEDFKWHQYIMLARGAEEQQLSPTHQYHSTRFRSYSRYAFFYREREKPKQAKLFLQFDDGEAAFISKSGYFQATESARKHLKMKNSKGEIVPINDATFEKFNKTNIDHKEW